MGKRTAAQSVIDKNNTVPEYTRPEIAFDKLFGNRVVKPLPIKIEDEGLSLCPDRHFVGTVVMVQIDGVYHDTERQRRKDEWRDRLLNERGFRVLHIAAELLTTKRHHEYVRQCVENFLVLETPTKRLAA